MEFVMRLGEEAYATFGQDILPRLTWRHEDSPLYYKAAFGYALLLSIGGRGTGSNARPSLARFFDKAEFNGHLSASDLYFFKHLRDDFYVKFNLAKTYRQFEINSEPEIEINAQKYRRLNFEQIYKKQTSVTNVVAYFVYLIIEEIYGAASIPHDSPLLSVRSLSTSFYNIIFDDNSELNQNNNRNYPKQFETRTRCQWQWTEFQNWIGQAHDKLAEIQAFEFSKFTFYLQNNETGTHIALTPFFPFANGLSFEPSSQVYDVSLAPEVQLPKRGAQPAVKTNTYIYEKNKPDNPSPGQKFLVIYNKFIEIISQSRLLDENFATALLKHLAEERRVSSNNEELVESPESIFPALQGIVDVKQSTQVSENPKIGKDIRRLRLASFLPCLLEGEFPDGAMASANNDVANTPAEKIRVFHLFPRQSADMPLHLIENFRSFTPQYATHLAEGRAEPVEKEDYVWAGPIWVGLAAGLLLSRHLGNWIDELETPAPESISVAGNIYFLTPLIPSLPDGQCYYYKSAKPLVLNRDTMQLGSDDSSEHRRFRLTYPSTSPNEVKSFYLIATQRSFPRLKKTNKGDLDNSMLSDDGIQWKLIPVRDIQVRVSPQQIMRSSFRKTAQEISKDEFDAITFKNATALTRFEIDRQAKEGDRSFLSHRYCWVNQEFAALYPQRGQHVEKYGQLDIDQEWCHLLGHGDGGEDASYNLVAASKHCNTQQLAIETAIRRFNDIHPCLHVHATAYLMGHGGELLNATQAQNRVTELKKKRPHLAELTERQLNVSEAIIESFRLLIQTVRDLKITDPKYFSEFNFNTNSNPEAVNATIFKTIFTETFEFLVNNDQRIEYTTLSKIFFCIVGLLGARRMQPISDLALEDATPATIFFQKIQHAPDLQKSSKNQLHALLDNYLSIATWACPTALFIRYAVKSSAAGNSGKLFDMMLDAQLENFDRNEFRLLSTAVKHLVLLTHPLKIGVAEKYTYYENISNAILENIDLFDIPSNTSLPITDLAKTFKQLWDQGFYLASNVTFTFDPFHFSITLLNAIPFEFYNGKLDAWVDEDASSYFENKIINLNNIKTHIHDLLAARDVANQALIDISNRTDCIHRIISDFDKLLAMVEERRRQDRPLSWDEPNDRNSMKNIEITIFNFYIEIVDTYWPGANHTPSTTMEIESEGVA